MSSVNAAAKLSICLKAIEELELRVDNLESAKPEASRGPSGFDEELFKNNMMALVQSEIQVLKAA